MKLNLCRAAVVLLASLLFAPLVSAHDPGLSAAEIITGNKGLQAKITFARRDMEVLVPMDTDHDGAVSRTEYTAAYPRLIGLAHRVLFIDIDNQRMPPASVAVAIDESDALQFRLDYGGVKAEAIAVESPVIPRLRRGHRQYLVVRDDQGVMLTETLLSARKPLILVTATAESTSLANVLLRYIVEGVWHIFIGLDHILFLLTLMLPAVMVYRHRHWQSVHELRPAVMEILKTVTAFSLAHSITLSLAVLEFVTLPQRWVESAIALSVLLVALNNLKPVFTGSRWWLAFAFGLIHGFGFANVLIDLGLSKATLAVSLLGFNLGVELGQVAIVMALFPLAYMLRDTRFYRGWAFKGGSVAAAALACAWFLERAFEYDLTAL